MPLRLPPVFRRQPLIRQRVFSTTRPVRVAIPAHFHTNTPPPIPKLGRIGRWYLPSMALIALSMLLYPHYSSNDASLSSHPTLGLANRKIGFAITNALDEHNVKKEAEWKKIREVERNRMLMAAYGDRESLEDMERAMEVYEVQ
ncbi:hypothetical protein CC78DRAFT_539452 [Lojkania enalia]|uniref:Uncharacterized protein n=1 Tax=Lojkania enalia TaxID=147567 RepID=A0A9P4TR39_9PLEO|nr:hypothetical protein CC78DRAFT_539452 [Didymosphaeria enalia]